MYKIENLPDIQKNYYLSARDTGPSRKLCGDIAIITFYLKKSSRDFSQETKEQCYSAMRTAVRWLEEKAQEHGTYLHIRVYEYNLDVPPDTDPEKGYSIVRDFLKEKSVENAQNYFEDRFNVDEAPLILVFDQNDRSFAYQHNTYYTTFVADEICVLFKSPAGLYEWTTVAHEILHQFGAQDYYFPAKIRSDAELFFKDSVMGVGKRDVVDELTAYLVGWRDTISKNTYNFLKSTMWMTKAIHDEASKRS